MYMATYIVYVCIYMHAIFNTYGLIVKVEKFIILILKQPPTHLSPYFPSVSYKYSLKVDWRFYSLLIKSSAFVLSQLGSGCILVFLNMEGRALVLTKLCGMYPKQGFILPWGKCSQFFPAFLSLIFIFLYDSKIDLALW